MDAAQIKRLPSLAKVEVIHAEKNMKELEETHRTKKPFGKRDFFRFVMLKKKFLTIPTKFWVYSKLSAISKENVRSALQAYVEARIKRLETIKNEQKSFGGKKLHEEFTLIEDLIEEIVESIEDSGPEILYEKRADFDGKHGEIDLRLKNI